MIILASTIYAGIGLALHAGDCAVHLRRQRTVHDVIMVALILIIAAALWPLALRRNA